MPIPRHQDMLRKYADLIVSVGLNLQRGQPLIIYSASSRGVALHNAPVVAEVTRAAYAAGASFVDVIWNDASSIRTRLQQATRETAAEYATWHIKALMDTIEAGGAMLTIRSNDPELLQGLDADTVAIWQRTHLHHFDPVLRAVTSNKINWCVVAAAGRAWAERIFPGLSPAKAEAQLWKAIFQMIRLDQPDPIAIWHKHLASLRRHADYLNERRYETLKYAGPGTDLTLSLPEGHRWIAARERTQSGIDFTANIPTEEVFTLPHRLGAEGTVRATMPLIYGGQRIEGFSLSFKRGRITDVSARTGEALLRELTTADEGASFLGEIALVSESSPIARRKTLFLDSLIDENAASHLAIGRAYRTCMQAADSIDDEEFLRRGGNTSIVHEDFMIGSDRLDVDGILPDGTSEPIMRGGEWAFDL